MARSNEKSHAVAHPVIFKALLGRNRITTGHFPYWVEMDTELSTCQGDLLRKHFHLWDFNFETVHPAASRTRLLMHCGPLILRGEIRQLYMMMCWVPVL